MKKLLVLLSVLLTALISTPSQAQFLKKLKEKANEAVNAVSTAAQSSGLSSSVDKSCLDEQFVSCIDQQKEMNYNAGWKNATDAKELFAKYNFNFFSSAAEGGADYNENYKINERWLSYFQYNIVFDKGKYYTTDNPTKHKESWTYSIEGDKITIGTESNKGEKKTWTGTMYQKGYGLKLTFKEGSNTLHFVYAFKNRKGVFLNGDLDKYSQSPGGVFMAKYNDKVVYLQNNLGGTSDGAYANNYYNLDDKNMFQYAYVNRHTYDGNDHTLSWIPLDKINLKGFGITKDGQSTILTLPLDEEFDVEEHTDKGLKTRKTGKSFRLFYGYDNTAWAKKSMEKLVSKMSAAKQAEFAKGASARNAALETIIKDEERRAKEADEAYARAQRSGSNNASSSSASSSSSSSGSSSNDKIWVTLVNESSKGDADDMVVESPRGGSKQKFGINHSTSRAVSGQPGSKVFVNGVLVLTFTAEMNKTRQVIMK